MQERYFAMDLESNRKQVAHLVNDSLHELSWRNLKVSVKDRRSGDHIPILTDAHGIVKAGEMLAIMGPSGSGKTTLLNVLASREAAAGATTSGEVLANGHPVTWTTIRQASSYVEQEDALIGSLTVRETVSFAARLSLPGRVSKAERLRRVDDLIASLGLTRQTDTIVGTPISKGLSGGQKKRLSVASSLVANPKILFLDEPTSGLDSTTSFEVMNFVRGIARKNDLIVIVSIHQPSTRAFSLFDKLCVMSRGKTCYFGATDAAPEYFSSIGYALPAAVNPAEFYLDLINADLLQAGAEGSARVLRIHNTWAIGSRSQSLLADIEVGVASNKESASTPNLAKSGHEKPAPWVTLLTMLHRSWIKGRRDVITYGVRLAMYLGLAIMMGTVFLRLKPEQQYIQPFINAIFFGGAFISFMAVAYVPAFLEDRATFVKERNNGLVGPLAFALSNFLIGLPFLFVITVVFSVVEYWMSNFRNDGHAFFMYTLWLFLDLLAAESLVVLVAAIFPVFVVALAVTAFANGLWMCVDGFLVPMGILNPFWKYAFHYIDYQAYVFQGMMVNEFKDRTYACARGTDGYQCMYPSELNSRGRIDGRAVLKVFDISLGREGQCIGIMVAIIFVYRVLGYAVLWLRKR